MGGKLSDVWTLNFLSVLPIRSLLQQTPLLCLGVRPLA